MPMRREDELYPEDLERVNKVVNSGIHSVKRKPFRPLILLLVVVLVIGGLGWLSRVIAQLVGAL